MKMKNMEIKNAIIRDVTVGFDGRDRLSASINFDEGYTRCGWDSVLTNEGDVQKLIKLMEYTGANKVEDLNGKIIRIVIADNYLYGFGHPIDDERFIPISLKECHEVTTSMLDSLVKN